MFLQRLTLHHYRNYQHVELVTDRNVNIFVGPNAQGKTNLLESIYVLALTKSHRTHHDKELIQWEGESALLQGDVEKKYGSYSLDLAISSKGKKAKINGLEQKKLSQFIGALNVVLFAPEDLEIIKGNPGIRRRFLDMEIGQVYPGYLYDLSQYQKVLAQRNNMLKKAFPAPSAEHAAMLDIWNEQLAQFGVKIMKKRQNFIKKLQNWAEQIHDGITNGGEELTIRYQPSFAVQDFEDETVLMEQFMIKLSQIKDQEIRRGVSLAGPHRDDLLFYINDKEVQTYGSQGQQRTTALSLKLAEIELIHSEVGEYPILLLDDVLSELDEYRQTQLIQTFQKKVQTFITTTGLESVHLDQLEDASVFRVTRDGRLKLKCLSI
ncbi:DNA replication/repair protein RecF [Paenibacillus larvae]|nr:DNA replication/repair protein RecF [Paenibacillus larvae]AVF20024.1 DNA replication and repair protein RecF [Paenibacillus larvae subsp. larvae]ETK29114.1 DNA replication and repair protein RecF [Paenibacillus larvae subsp. larvae DSM 25719]MCY7475225.1 DNA replication/repair protein RecF [Paenibacillus larvae]MCY7488408.1 DNA replication/repair protein RecF [Paenibacillus larvae]MCY9562694.1 DNA replication/repair protein RecF [Paenibacillus larvae]